MKSQTKKGRKDWTERKAKEKRLQPLATLAANPEKYYTKTLSGVSQRIYTRGTKTLIQKYQNV